MDKHDILEAIVGASSDAIVTADATGRIVTWNPAAGKIFGYTAKEAIGQDLSILVPTEFREAHKAGLARVVKTGKTKVIGQVVALRGLRKDGTEFPLELTLSTWKLGDEP
ncbi:MAG TPA: PAS domain S-box protein, partial [Paracoccaceae bacterium]|nr:PAS domain S-box protein [Paracoccaceae bacterium]